MLDPAIVSTATTPPAFHQTRFDEGHVWVTSGTRHCPLPSLCDRNDDETYEEYVHRHATNHNLGTFDDTEDAERNLGVWCGFFYARYVQGNESLGTKNTFGDHKIEAQWEPCWEDAEYIFNDEFSREDLEMDIPWKERTFVLLPFDQRSADAEYKRFKKFVKTRATQKTSWGKAKVTFELLHARFILNNLYFRVLTISKASTIARTQYFLPLKQLWSRNANIKRLYGIWETRCDKCRRTFQTPEKPPVCPDESCVDELKHGTRRHNFSNQVKPQRVGIVTRGSFGRDTVTARWIVNDENSSAMSIMTLMCAGVDSTLVGSRWDLILFDDPHDRSNIKTPMLRQNVKDLHVELRKQLDAAGRLVWLCTPWHVDDASAEIDEKYSDEFHIMYRPAMWHVLDATGTPVPQFYWQKDALGRVVWSESRLKIESTKSDYSSQILLQPRDPKSSIYNEDDFPVVEPKDAPIEIRFGLGRDLTEQEENLLRAEGKDVYAYNFIDSAGKVEQTVMGCDTGHVGARISFYGEIFITYISSGQWQVSEELADLWAGYLRNRPSTIVYELSGAHQKWVFPAIYDFTAKKSKELGRPISLPIVPKPVSTNEGQEQRIESMHPYITQRRVKILADAGTPEQIAKFKNQFVHYVGSKRDLADAASRILEFLTPGDEDENSNRETAAFQCACGNEFDGEVASGATDWPCPACGMLAQRKPEEETEGFASVPMSHILDRISEMDGAQDAAWGLQGSEHTGGNQW